MQYSTKTGRALKQKTPCLILSHFEGKTFNETLKEIDDESKGFLSKLQKQKDLTGELNKAVVLHHVPTLQAERLIIVGCGKTAPLTDNQFKQVLCAAISKLLETGAKDAMISLNDFPVQD